MQNLITIHAGQYNRQQISGTFYLSRPYREYSESDKKPGGYAREGYTGFARVSTEPGSKPFSVHLRADSFSLGEVGTQPNKSSQSTEQDLEKMDYDIRQRFEVLDLFSEAVVAGQIRSMVVSGAPGVGKTYTLEKRLKEAEVNGEIQSVTHVKGKSTPLYLYQLLWENNQPGQVLLMDDTDSVFGDDTACNILKSALDSSEERWITYGSAAKYLEQNDIPQTFKFEGTVVFISNLDFFGMIQRGTGIAPHLNAIMSRTHYLTLNVYTKREIMVRVQQIMLETPVLDCMGVSEDIKGEILEYLWENLDNLREVSIRTLLKIGEYYQISGEDWKKTADVMLMA